jgi:hypothetical protein
MSILEVIRRGRDLPDVLGLDDILTLIEDSGRYDVLGIFQLACDMQEKAHSGHYPSITFKDTPSKYGLNSIRKIAGKKLLLEPVLTRQAVKNMFEDLRIDSIPGDALFSKWLGEAEKKATQKKGKREPQIKMICEVAQRLGYSLKAIPEKGKQKIKSECINKRPDLFSESSFVHAWKKASKDGIISIENKSKYLSRPL